MPSPRETILTTLAHPSGVGVVSDVFGLPIPGHEFVHAIDLVIRQTLEDPCEPRFGVDIVHLGGLCRTPNYAEW